MVHEKSAFYDVAGFKAGKTTLNPLELEELGDVKNKTLLHLQCHFGLDTLSWAREGAKVTGIDFSEKAITLAKNLAEELSLDARFICSDVYALPENLQGRFDVVFTSYGALPWLPNLEKWANVVAHFLKPGGVFYLAEFHPVLWMFDNDMRRLTYPYFNHGAIVEEANGTYADRDAPICNQEITWNHGLGEVISALTGQGLRIEFVHELPYSFYNAFASAVRAADGFYRLKNYENILPLTYSIRATKR